MHIPSLFYTLQLIVAELSIEPAVCANVRPPAQRDQRDQSDQRRRRRALCLERSPNGDTTRSNCR